MMLIQFKVRYSDKQTKNVQIHGKYEDDNERKRHLTRKLMIKSEIKLKLKQYQSYHKIR